MTQGEEIYRICEVCKEKELHTHTYGDWEFQLKDMSRRCIECGSTESLDLDPELALQTLLPGHRSFSHADLGKTIRYTHEENNTISFYLNINEDGSVSFWDETTLNNSTWARKEHAPT